MNFVNNNEGKTTPVHSTGRGGKTYICNTIAAVVCVQHKVADGGQTVINIEWSFHFLLLTCTLGFTCLFSRLYYFLHNSGGPSC